MANVEKIVCDGCGATKTTVNHWYLVSEYGGFMIQPWSEALQVKEYRHVCGQQCAHKLLDEFFQKVNGQ